MRETGASDLSCGRAANLNETAKKPSGMYAYGIEVGVTFSAGQALFRWS